MLHPIERRDRADIVEMAASCGFGYLADSILEGRMGEVFADRSTMPRVAVLEVRNRLFGIAMVLGDASCSAAEGYVGGIPAATEVFCGSPAWNALLCRVHGDRAVERPRYVLTGRSLRADRLEVLARGIPDGYKLVAVDGELADRLLTEEEWSDSGHGINFEDSSDFVENGFGFCLLCDDEIVSAASTFAVSKRGIEIQINTRADHRRRGLAIVVGAALVADSMHKGLDPCWDAANDASVALARRLGFEPAEEHTTVLILPDGEASH